MKKPLTYMKKMFTMNRYYGTGLGLYPYGDTEEVRRVWQGAVASL